MATLIGALLPEDEPPAPPQIYTRHLQTASAALHDLARASATMADLFDAIPDAEAAFVVVDRDFVTALDAAMTAVRHFRHIKDCGGEG